MSFSCCVSDPIFWFAAPEILTLILLLPHNLFLTKSRFNISNSCSHRGLTSILLLHQSTWKGQGNSSVDQSPHLLTHSWHAPSAYCSIKHLCWAEALGTNPKGLCMLLWARKALPGLQNTQRCRRLSPPSHSQQAGLVPSRTEFALKLTSPLKSKAAEWQSQARDHQ